MDDTAPPRLRAAHAISYVTPVTLLSHTIRWVMNGGLFGPAECKNKYQLLKDSDGFSFGPMEIVEYGGFPGV